MRLALLLTSTTYMTWSPADQYKLRGLIWNALEGSTYESLHDDSSVPTFTFSNIFAIDGSGSHSSVIEEGTPCMCFVSSPHPGLLDVIGSYVSSQDEVVIGNNRFTVDRVETRSPDVGRVGTTGTMKTQTGLYLRLPAEKRNEYGVETPYEGVISWTPDHGSEAFRSRVTDSAQWSIESVNPRQTEPTSFGELFDSVSYLTTFEAAVPVTTEYVQTFIPTVCEFGYTVRSETHRKWLNTLLDSGLGWRTSLGFGFLNITS